MFNTLKKTSLALLVASASLVQFSCNNDVDADKLGNWYKSGIPSFGGSARSHAVSFVIGTKGYIGTGYTNETIQRVKDFWSYDATTKNWSQVADFTGTGRQDAVAFVVGGKAYVGTGYDANIVSDLAYKKDFYQFDPATNKWKAVADFPATRQYASAFVVGDKAYVGLGYNGSGFYQDFHMYDATTDTWTSKIATFTGGKRRGANAFTLGGVAYVGFGQNNSSAPTKDLYKFDPAGGSDGSGSWTKMEDSNDDLTARSFSFTLIMNEKAYIVGGSGASDVWEYTPGSNTWVSVAPFIPGARGYAAGFTLTDQTLQKEVGFIGTGISGGSNATDDLWAFDPGAAIDDDDDN